MWLLSVVLGNAAREPDKRQCQRVRRSTGRRGGARAPGSGAACAVGAVLADERGRGAEWHSSEGLKMGRERVLQTREGGEALPYPGKSWCRSSSCRGFGKRSGVLSMGWVDQRGSEPSFAGCEGHGKALAFS